MRMQVSLRGSLPLIAVAILALGSVLAAGCAVAQTSAAKPAAPAATPAPAAAPAAPAASAPMPEEEASAQALALAVKRLSLTEEQTAKIKPLLDANVKRLRKLMADYTGAGASVMPSFLQEFTATRENFRNGVLPILTDPQKVQFDTLRQEVDAALRDQICDYRVASLKDRLALTPEQQEAIRPILKADFEKKRALLAVYTAPTGGPQARRPLSDQAREVQAATEVKLATVLSPEQMKTYRADLAAKVEAAEDRAAQP